METLDDRLAEVKAEFELAGDWNDRYRLLVDWSDDLDPLPSSECLADHEVPGCSSPLWLRARWSEGVLRVQGASPGILPKALVALVCRLFDGLESVGPLGGLLDDLGLRRNLSPTRFLVLENMVDRVVSVARDRP